MSECMKRLIFLLDNIIFILDLEPSSIDNSWDSGLPMGTKCATVVADLFLYCYEKDGFS